MRPLHVTGEESHPVEEVSAHRHKSVARLAPALIDSPETDELADFFLLNQVEDMSIVETRTLDMVDGQFDLMLVTDLDHFVGLNQVASHRFFAEYVDTAPGCS